MTALLIYMTVLPCKNLFHLNHVKGTFILSIDLPQRRRHFFLCFRNASHFIFHISQGLGTGYRGSPVRLDINRKVLMVLYKAVY